MSHVPTPKYPAEIFWSLDQSIVFFIVSLTSMSFKTTLMKTYWIGWTGATFIFLESARD